MSGHTRSACPPDVRLNPLSRKPGLSKTKLSAALADAGVEYVRLRPLGNPRENRTPAATAPDQSEVLGVAEERNELLHAVARNRCVTCGTATPFEHPRTGKLIERSEEAVQALTERLLDLRERGGEIAARSRAS